jgi:hypothetical protein
LAGNFEKVKIDIFFAINFRTFPEKNIFRKFRLRQKLWPLKKKSGKCLVLLAAACCLLYKKWGTTPKSSSPMWGSRIEKPSGGSPRNSVGTLGERWMGGLGGRGCLDRLDPPEPETKYYVYRYIEVWFDKRLSHRVGAFFKKHVVFDEEGSLRKDR